MMEINDVALDRFEDELMAAIKPLEEKYQIKIQVEKTIYNSVSFKTTLDVRRSDLDTDRILWQSKCHKYNLIPEDYMAKITLNNVNYHLVGIDTSKRKYPIIIQAEKSKALVGTTPHIVLKALGRK